MKTIYNKILVFALAIIGVLSITSCEKENEPNGGEPRINYVRVTNPLSKDSLLVGAYQGSLVAIIGENLQDAREIWFNDQQATVTPTYVTSTSILVSVPSPIPKVITNKLRIMFGNGKILEYAFSVTISEPAVANMLSEFVVAGEVATIRGDYFYEPITVTFFGGKVGELVSVTDKILQVRVPDGVEAGPITVTTNFGATKSQFWFRDNRNVVLSSDPYTGWWNEAYVVKPADIVAGDPPAISGNYIRFKKSIGAWSWNEVAGGPPDAMGPISKNIPDEAILKPTDYNLKFEINTIKPYNNNVLKINVGLDNNFNNDQYTWMPPYDTKGQWQTVIIPFEEVVASYGGKLTPNPNGYYTRLLFHGPGDLDADISLDNFRIVPKFIK